MREEEEDGETDPKAVFHLVSPAHPTDDLVHPARSLASANGVPRLLVDRRTSHLARQCVSARIGGKGEISPGLDGRDRTVWDRGGRIG